MSTLSDKLRAFDAELPLERARTIPSSWYFDPEIHEAERRCVFGNTWQCAGRLDAVGEAGAFFTTEIAGEPIVVVRGDDGVLRAFYNVCRHRAAKVMCAASGKASRLRCRYHGWTYDLAGRLRGTPEFDGVADFQREHEGLVPLALAIWGPLVWVRPASHPTSATPPAEVAPLLEYLDPLPARTSPQDVESVRFVERRAYEVACNWKVCADNFLDGGYHVNTVHAGLASVLDYAQYRTEVAGNTSVQISPLKPPDPGKDQAVGKVRTGTHACYWWVFPNFVMSIYQGVLITSVFEPLGPARSRVVIDFYFADVDGPEARGFIDQSIAVSDRIQKEDNAICEEVQQGMASRSYSSGRYSVSREIAIHHFHRLLARRLQQSFNQ